MRGEAMHKWLGGEKAGVADHAVRAPLPIAP